MFQGQHFYIPTLLTLSNTPVAGILRTALTMTYWKAGASAFLTRPVSVGEWTELANGYYSLTLPLSLLDTVGTFLFKLTGTGFDPYVRELVVEPPPISAVVSASTCVINGSLVDIGGSPGRGQVITFRIVSVPSKTGGGSLVASDSITTYPDALGNFSVLLIRTAVVYVEIDRAGINYQFTVPDQSSANLIDLLPAIP